MRLSENPTIRYLAAIDPSLMQFFAPVERVIIEICREIIEESK
jgi:hypothetical protein